MQDAYDSVRQFHTTMNAPVSSRPTLLDCDQNAAAALAERVKTLVTETMAKSPEDDVLLSRAAMVMEELAEWLTAHAHDDLVSAADAWADRAYVLFGDAVAGGLPAAELFAEVHRSNMTKELDSAGTGKAVKGSAYQPPNIQSVLS